MLHELRSNIRIVNISRQPAKAAEREWRVQQLRERSGPLVHTFASLFSFSTGRINRFAHGLARLAFRPIGRPSHSFIFKPGIRYEASE